MVSCSSDGEGNKSSSCGRIGVRPYWVLLLSVVIRAVHQVGAAVFLTFYLTGTGGRMPAGYLYLAVISGILLLATEAMRHRQIYRETAGIATLVKVCLIGLAFHGILPATVTVPAAFVLAALAAHLPKEIRHRLLY